MDGVAGVDGGVGVETGTEHEQGLKFVDRAGAGAGLGSSCWFLAVVVWIASVLQGGVGVSVSVAVCW
jgi:hypothetical protein